MTSATIHKTRATWRSWQTPGREAIFGPWGVWTMFGDVFSLSQLRSVVGIS